MWKSKNLFATSICSVKKKKKIQQHQFVGAVSICCFGWLAALIFSGTAPFSAAAAAKNLLLICCISLLQKRASTGCKNRRRRKWQQWCGYCWLRRRRWRRGVTVWEERGKRGLGLGLWIGGLRFISQLEIWYLVVKWSYNYLLVWDICRETIG